jgi:uncharacterized membrane protein
VPAVSYNKRLAVGICLRALCASLIPSYRPLTGMEELIGMKRTMCRLVGVALLLVLAVPALHAAAYQMRYLNTPEGFTSEPRAINELGQVVGELYSPALTTVALWDMSGNPSTPLPPNTWAYDISSSGELVGEFHGSDGYSHPYIWTSDTGLRDLSADLPISAHVWRIGAGGMVAGTDDATWPSSRAFVWDAASGLTYLPTTDYQSAYAVGVSDWGVVAGTVELDDHSARAFVWSADKGLTVISPDAPENEALAISTSGAVLGSAWPGEGIQEPFVWTAELGRLSAGTTSWDNWFCPCAVNDKGYVAGTMCTLGGPEQAFVWNPRTGAFTILGEGRACDINNAGWVVGQVGGSDNGQTVLWQPVPEPSSLMVLGIGVLPIMGVLARRQRRR